MQRSIVIDGPCGGEADQLRVRSTYDQGRCKTRFNVTTASGPPCVSIVRTAWPMPRNSPDSSDQMTRLALVRSATAVGASYRIPLRAGHRLF